MVPQTQPQGPDSNGDRAPAGGDRFRAGDGVLARASDGQLTPLGRVDSVLGARSGTQLVVERAFQPGRFTPLAAERVEVSDYDPEADLRWHVVGIDAAAAARLPVYRRALGRLTPDPLQVISPAPGDDAATTQSLAAILASDPLVGMAETRVRVTHGVAVLTGWVQTVGAKVAADRLARTSPGVWDVKNRLVSDEELATLARQRAVADPTIAASVGRVTSDLGRMEVHLQPSAATVPERFLNDLRALPGCREVKTVGGRR